MVQEEEESEKGQNEDLLEFNFKPRTKNKKQGLDIIEMFAKEIELEKHVQLKLGELIACEDFHTIDAFRFFDINENGQVDTYEIKKGLEAAKIPFDIDSICIFMGRFDKTGDQMLKYSEFCEAFLQRDEAKLKQIA